MILKCSKTQQNSKGSKKTLKDFERFYDYGCLEIRKNNDIF